VNKGRVQTRATADNNPTLSVGVGESLRLMRPTTLGASSRGGLIPLGWLEGSQATNRAWYRGRRRLARGGLSDGPESEVSREPTVYLSRDGCFGVERIPGLVEVANDVGGELG